MTPRYHTAGNAKPWAFGGYRDRMAVPGPIEQEPIRWGIIAWMIAIALVPVMVGVWL